MSILSKRLAEPDVAEGKLCACDLAEGNPTRSFNLVYHREKYFTEQMRAFSEICRALGRGATDALSPR